jgi:hypothetical protein
MKPLAWFKKHFLHWGTEKKTGELKRDSWGRLVDRDDSYTIPNNKDFERAVWKELVEDPKREKELREETWRDSTERFREYQRKRQKKAEEDERNRA